MTNTSSTTPTIVTSLICHRDVPMAVKCLGSLQKYSRQRIHFTLHDDGSLQEDDVALLTHNLHSPTIIRKQEADERMEDTLANFPFSYKLRNENVLAKKLFDCVLFNNNEIFACCDTDILFFRPFLDPFVLPDDYNATFLKDSIHPYSIRVRDFFEMKEVKIVQHVNAGMICFRRSHYDLDFIEWLLSKRIFHSKPYLIEQTLWAILGQKATCRLWNPTQIVYMTSSIKMRRSVVAGHFVSPARHLLKQYVENHDSICTDDPVKIETIPSKLCHPLDIAWMVVKSEAGRKLSRMPKRNAQP